MTDQEKICLDKTIELYNELNKLGTNYSDGGNQNDMQEAVFHIHALQNYIFARAGIRAHRLNEKK